MNHRVILTLGIGATNHEPPHDTTGDEWKGAVTLPYITWLCLISPRLISLGSVRLVTRPDKGMDRVETSSTKPQKIRKKKEEI